MSQTRRRKAATSTSRRFSERTLAVLVCLLLVGIVLIVFGPVRHFEFTSFDDPDYVTANSAVTGGMTAQSVMWAFTSTATGNWHPVTWLSHMLDAELYGSDAGGHHVTSLVLHLTNALLLFGLLLRTTGERGRSAFVAALFAVHPLHVESVAWVAERKDVLSTLFWLLTLWAYVAYVRRPRRATYLLVVLAFAVGLMAKPMLVTLPFLLLLMDVWPLRRLNPESRSMWELVYEKLPLLALSIVSSIVTVVVQGSSVRTLQEVPLPLRAANVIRSYVVYIREALVPVGLEPFYTYPRSVAWWLTAAGIIGLAGMSVFALRGMTRRPWLFVGWFWYLGTLIPVIGLVQVGRQAMADRYTYVPLIGLFIIGAWGIPDLLARWSNRRLALPLVSTLVILACVLTARAQVQTWADTITLWEHALRVDPENAMAHHSLGVALAVQGRLDEAMAHDREALRLDPELGEAWTNLGATLAIQEHHEDAAAAYRNAIQLLPNDAVPHVNLGRALAQLGRGDEAIDEFGTALRLDPSNSDAHSSLGLSLARVGRIDDAIAHYREALRFNPRDAITYFQLGLALEEKGNNVDARRNLETAISLDPTLMPAQDALADLIRRGGR